MLWLHSWCLVSRYIFVVSLSSIVLQLIKLLKLFLWRSSLPYWWIWAVSADFIYWYMIHISIPILSDSYTAVFLFNSIWSYTAQVSLIAQLEFGMDREVENEIEWLMYPLIASLCNWYCSISFELPTVSSLLPHHRGQVQCCRHTFFGLVISLSKNEASLSQGPWTHPLILNN